MFPRLPGKPPEFFLYKFTAVKLYTAPATAPAPAEYPAAAAAKTKKRGQH